jgi:hypothetical protein
MLLLIPSLFRRIVHPCLDQFEASRGNAAVAM